MTYVGIQSEIKEARINSLEFLDNILQSRVKMMVLPVIENYIIEENQTNPAIIKLDLLSEKRCLQRTIKMGGVQLKILVLKYIQVSKNKNFSSILLPLNKFKNKEVNAFATTTYHLIISNK